MNPTEESESLHATAMSGEVQESPLPMLNRVDALDGAATVDVTKASDPSEKDRTKLMEKQIQFLTCSLRSLEERLVHQETVSYTDEEVENLKQDDDGMTEKQGNDGMTEKQDNDGMTEDQDNEEDAELRRIPHTSLRAVTNRASLSEDTFSFLISSHLLSAPFFCGFFVFCLKNLIFYLVLSNMINPDVPFNKLGIPVSVDTTVVISQYIAFVISVLTQNDLITALIHVFQGYNRSMRHVFGRNGHGGGHKGQWLFAVIALSTDGIFGLIVTFLLVVTSNTVLNVLLNFAAVEFVAGLDEAVFYLANTGFLGTRLHHESVVVKESTYVIRKSATELNKHRVQTTGLMAVLLWVMGVWTYLFWLQRTGVYNPNYLIVQFDDSILRGLGAYSGFYVLKTNSRKPPPRRFRYVATRGARGEFAYCRKHREWSFFTKGNDPCDYANVVVKSGITHELDMSKLKGDAWLVKRPGSQHFIPMQNFFMDIGCLVDRHCGNVGKCINHKCVCNRGYFGPRCDFNQSNSCPQLALDSRFELSFPSNRPLATSFKQLLPKNSSDPHVPTLYHHPIYYNPSPVSNATDILIYLGLRWGVTQIRWMDNVSSLEELRHPLFDQTFSAAQIQKVFTLSDPVSYNTPDDKRSNPIKVNWNLVELSGPLARASVVASANPVSLLCSKCNNYTNKCSYDNVCAIDGTCQCTNGATGVLCQTSPTGDGICHPHFNRRHFQFDGGDCCRRYCSGQTGGNQCGVTTFGTVSKVDIGFPNCQDPSVVGSCANSSEPCYIPNSESVSTVSPGRGVYPIISSNGRVLVAGETSIGLVRIFDMVDSTWVQRGFDLRSGRHSGFGRVIAIATPPSTVFNGALGKIPMLLAIGEDQRNRVRIFQWDQGATSWTEGAEVSVALTATNTTGVVDGYSLKIGFNFFKRRHSLITLLVETHEFGTENHTVLMFRRGFLDTNWTVQESFVGRQAGAVTANGNVVALISADFSTVSIHDFLPPKNQVALNTSYSLVTQTGLNKRILAMAVTDARGHYDEDEIGVGIATMRSTITGTYVDIDFYVLTLLSNTTEWERKGNQTVEVVNSPTVDAVFSNDGRAVVLSFETQGILHYQTYRFDGEGTLVKFSPLATTFSQRRIGVVSISDKGYSLVDGASGAVQVYETGYPSCGPGDVTYRISINMNELPESVSWSLNAYTWANGTIQVSNSFFWCDRCFRGSLYAWTVTAQEICVPAVSLPCLGLEFQANFKLKTNGFASYIMEGHNSSFLFAADSGSLPSRSEIPYHLNLTDLQTASCRDMSYER